jgi:hypothetical protein
MLKNNAMTRTTAYNKQFGKSGGSVLRMTVFRKFEVCASYEHLWLNRHLRQAAKRCASA